MADNDYDLKIGADASNATAEFNKLSGKADQSAEAIAQAMREASYNMSKSFKESSENMQAEFSKMTQSAEKMHGSMGGIFNQLKGLVAGVAIFDLGKQALAVMADFEQLQVGLNSVMGSAKDGEQAFAWIKQFATDTPFEVNQVAQSFRVLKAYGIDPMNGSLRAIADMASYTGKGFDGMQSATLALGQAWTKAKLQGDDILQMVQVGIPVWDILAKATGKTGAELMTMSEKGLLGRDAITALIAGMQEISSGASAAQMNTLTGKWSNFTDAIKNALDEIRRTGAVDGLRDALEGITGLIPPLSSLFQAFGDLVGSVFRSIGEIWGSLTSSISSGVGQDVKLIDILKVAFEMLRILVVGLKTAFEITFEAIKGVLTVAGAQLVTFGNTAKAALSLDFTGAKAAWKQGMADIEGIVAESAANIVKIAEKNNAAIFNYGGGKAEAPTLDTSAKVTAKPVSEWDTGKGSGKAKKSVSRAGDWKAELTAQLEAEGSYFKDSLNAELAFWQAKLAMTKAGSKERAAVEHEIYALKKKQAQDGLQSDLAELKAQAEAYQAGGVERIRIAGEIAAKIGEKYGLESKEYKNALADMAKAAQEHQKQMDKLEDMRIDRIKEHQQSALDMNKETIKQQQAMGEISDQQALQALAKLMEDEYQIELKAAQDKAALITTDEIAKQASYDKLANMAEKHRLDMAKINNQMALAQKTTWDKNLAPITSAFSKTVQGIIQGTLTMKQGLSNIFKSIALEFANMSVKMVVEWLSNEARKTMATAVGVATRTTTEAAGAATSKSISGGSAIVEIMNSAYAAMAGAYKAIALIPYVGPVLAPIAAGVAFGAVAGLAGSIMSAEGGYDIPRGVNPITQLHENEMVLPSAQADAVRNMADGGGGGGDTHFHIHSLDSKDAARYFKDNGHHLAAALKQQVRNFNTGR